MNVCRQREQLPANAAAPGILFLADAEVRRSWIAVDDGEFNLEVRCLAVPVKDFTGQIIGALGISAPTWRLSNQILQSRAKIVQAAAGRLSASFDASA